MNEDKNIDQANQEDDHVPVESASVPEAKTLHIFGQKLGKKNAITLSVVLLTISIGLIFVLWSNSTQTPADTAETMNSDQSTLNNSDLESELDSNELDGSLVTGIPTPGSMVFDTPQAWSVLRSQNSDDPDPNNIRYTLISPDVRNVQDGYIGINGGLGVEIYSYERDFEKEKEYDEPWKSYISKIGAPRIEDDSLEYYEQETDYTEITSITNSNGVELQYYPWAYEGCFIHVIALDETKSYSLSIKSGENGCPKASIVEDNTDIATFIDSIAFKTDETITAAAYIDELTNKGEEETKVYTSSINFTFNSGSINNSDGNGVNLFVYGSVPILDDELRFQYLNIGDTEEGIRNAYGCEGCGFTSLVYGQSIGYSKNAELDEYTKITDTIYGKTSDIDPVNSGTEAKARKYTYTKLLDDEQHFNLEFIVESTEGEYALKIPELNNNYIITVLESLKTISSL